MYSVFDIAKWFLYHESMTHKKLQKLCYYAQAWHCALYSGTPLFSEVIQAWVHGSVSPDLYRKYADYGWTLIPKETTLPNITAEDAIDILESVYETYGEFDGDQLEFLIHNEDPWKITRGDLEPWIPSTAIIPTELMGNYYRKKYQESQND